MSEISAKAVVASVRAHLYNEPLRVSIWLLRPGERKRRWWHFSWWPQ